MTMLEIIEKKRDNKELTREEIAFFIRGYNEGSIPDYQASALLMAVYLNKMTDRETADLTRAMTNTGETVDLTGVPGVKVDKHSSGGVGDKITLVVGPMVAACGLAVAKMSGRGLGFGGGTIDKLEAIPGFRTTISREEFIRRVRENNIAIMGQSLNIAPADKKLYALRDVTGTVENISLIASSIMSKKLACNSDAIVLDVKAGSGAFMKTLEAAAELADRMVRIGIDSGRQMVAAITNMDQPLGYAVGNALEVVEAVESLRGNGREDFMEVCMVIGSLMLTMGGLAATREEARDMLRRVLEDGSAYEKFLSFAASQGGDVSALRDTSKLARASFVLPVRASAGGYVTAISGEEIGNATLAVGAGRYDKTDVIDYAAGATIIKKIGEQVEKGDVVAYIHANDEEKGKRAVELAANAYRYGGGCRKKPMLFAIVDKDGVHWCD